MNPKEKIPTMRSEDMGHERLIALEEHHTSGAYPKRACALVHGQGTRVWDAQGRSYLDMTSGQGVALLGHNHPELREALKRQAQRLITCAEIFYNDQRAMLYEALSRFTPSGLDRFFLCNSGAEAIEGAIKLARVVTGRKQVVAIKGGFHGRTLGALSATWKSAYREPFAPLVPGFSHIAFNDCETAREFIDEDTAAVVVEVIQGEGGVHPASLEFLQTLRRLCTQHGAMLIFDEIQTGLGRTGRWFALDYYGVIPDVLCLGKGVAGGVPMGAVVWNRSWGSLPSGSHGSTFGGNPLACASAIATLRVLEHQALPARAAELGTWWIHQLQSMAHPWVREVRGRGLMVGIALRRKVTPVLKRLMALGVLALPAGPTVLRLLPPLIISRDELDYVCRMISIALGEADSC